MVAKLYELSSDFQQVQSLIEDGQEGLQDTLESIELSIEDKLENIGKVYQNLKGEVAALKTEEKRLADKRKSIENNIDRLKAYSQDALAVVGKDKLQTGLFTFSIRKNAPKVIILDENDIPKDYLIEQQPKVDKNLLKEAIKNGEKVPGVALEQGRSLWIK